LLFSSALERRVDNRETLLVLFESNVGYVEQLPSQFISQIHVDELLLECALTST